MLAIILYDIFPQFCLSSGTNVSKRNFDQSNTNNIFCGLNCISVDKG